jgi:hypothetical protein
MRATRTTTSILILVSLLLVGAVIWAGCGNSGSSAKGTPLSKSEAFVASAAPGAQGDGTITHSGTVSQVRNATVSYKVDATDPRVVGTFDVVYNLDQAADGSGKMWGTWTVTNNKGTWVCEALSGSLDSSGHTFVFGSAKGTGAYAGLVSLWQWYWPLNTSSFSASLPLIAVSGWIQKAQ